MRRSLADWTAGLMAGAILVLGGLLVVKPALDHWDSLYRADPFAVGATTQTVEKKRVVKPAEKRSPEKPAAGESAENSTTSDTAGTSTANETAVNSTASESPVNSTTSEGGGNSSAGESAGRSARARTKTRTTTTKTRTIWPEASAAERALGNGGLLFLRVGVVALAALLVGTALQRAISGNFALRARPRTARAPLPAPDREPYDWEHEPAARSRTPARSGATAVRTTNGRERETAEEAREATGPTLAGAIAMLVASRREELGLSQRELAKRAGVSHTVISRIEGGEHTPSPKTVERLTEALRERL